MTHHFFVLCFAALICSVLTMPAGSYQSPWNRNDWRYNDLRRDPTYDAHYYNDYINNRRFYDNDFKRYQQKTLASDARILRMDSVPHETGGAYGYAYETENGIKVQERGVPYDLGPKGQKEGVAGSYSYISPEGLHVHVRYTADETGFHPYITYDGPGANILSRNAMPADVKVRRNDQ